MLSSNCQIDVLAATALSESDCNTWRRITCANEELDSPYFLPEYFQWVGRSCDTISVLRVKESDQPILYWPIQRQGTHGHPVGYRLNDFHGMVAEKRVLNALCQTDITSLMRQAGLATWSFGGLVPGDPLHRYSILYEPAFALNLEAGFEAYQQALASSGTQQLKQLARKRRKLEREIGKITFEFDASDLPSLQQLFAWKRGQYRSTGRPDVLAPATARSLLESLFELPRNGALRPCFSILRAGENLVAMHLGMRTGRIAHWWFPAYDPAFAKYSTGKILLLELAKALAARGIVRLDLGPGEESYKSQFGSLHRSVGVGAADLSLVRSAARRVGVQAVDWLKRSRFKKRLKQLAGVVRPTQVAASEGGSK